MPYDLLTSSSNPFSLWLSNSARAYLPKVSSPGIQAEYSALPKAKNTGIFVLPPFWAKASDMTETVIPASAED